MEESATRLDQALVQLGLARSRSQAQDYLQAGRVTVAGKTITKPAYRLAPGQVPQLHAAQEPEYLSRAGGKLAGALMQFGAAQQGAAGLDPRGKHCLDVGACTGGFTGVLLEAGAASVLAVDVGHNQLLPQLRADPRVTALDGVNARDLPAALRDHQPGRISLVVGDLSFISLTMVLPAIVETISGGDLVLLIKPQFEVGRERLGRGGVVRNDADRQFAVRQVLEAGARLGLQLRGLTTSEVPGTTGNIEYLVWFTKPVDNSEWHTPNAGNVSDTEKIGEALPGALNSAQIAALAQTVVAEGQVVFP